MASPASSASQVNSLPLSHPGSPVHMRPHVYSFWEGDIRDGTFWKRRARAQVGAGLGSPLASRPWGGMYGGGQSVVQGIPPVGLGLQGLRMSSGSRPSVLTWTWVGPISHRRLPPGDPRGSRAQGSNSTRLLWAAAAACRLGPSCSLLASAAPPCTTTWAALHPSCWPLRPKRAGKWGRPPQPPLALNEGPTPQPAKSPQLALSWGRGLKSRSCNHRA